MSKKEIWSKATIIAISSPRSKELHKAMIYARVWLLCYSIIFLLSIKEILSFFPFLSTLPHHKVLLEIWENLQILPVCLPTKELSSAINSRKFCISSPSKRFHVTLVRGTVFDFFLSLVRLETETLTEFPGGDWMQFAESRQARPGC